MRIPALLKPVHLMANTAPWLKKRSALLLLLILALLPFVLILVFKAPLFPLCIIYALGVGTIFHYAGLREQKADIRLLHGPRSIGRIMKKSESHSRSHASMDFGSTGNDSDNYYVEYSFEPLPGELLKGSGEIPWSAWESLKVGDTIEVAFDADNHAKNRPAAKKLSSVIEIFIGSIGMTMTAGIWMFIIAAILHKV